MQRYPKLQDLSRGHHHVLQLALQARRAATSGDLAMIEAAAATCRAAFSDELYPYFLGEENSLLPLLVATGEYRLIEQVVSDHTELRRLSIQLQRAGAVTILAFAERLAVPCAF